ncbi:MAG: hypothetical protein EOM87_07640, partial [Clostridia bacterium]|nr:hypothetical protein [Clostridia bacterium]
MPTFLRHSFYIWANTTNMKKFLLIGLVITVTAAAFAGIIIGVTIGSAELQDNKLTSKNREIAVFDNRGIELSGNSDYYIEYDDIPKNLINAFISIEDKRFYKHNGLDYKRIVGSAVSNVKSGSFSEGASTITCQLIKNTHLSSDKTLSRKLKEAKLALEVERNYSKEDIITMYLNVIYFGNSVYGAGRAARVFFDKDAKALTLEEAASLAAVVVNPSKYSPLINYEANKERRKTILRLMYEQEYISESDYLEASKKDLFIVGNTMSHNTQSYKQNAIDEACRLLNMNNLEILDSGIKVYTYCDSDKQQILYSALTNKNLLVKNSNGKLPDTAAMLVDNNTAGINAYYSSVYYMVDNFRRQPGSIIKPIAVYGAALEKGVLLPSTPILDEPTDFEGYSPKNYNDNYMGWVNARSALS